MKLILIEGTNCAGKTTLAKFLCEKYGLVYRKENKPDRPGFEYYVEKLVSYGESPTLCDRFHIGEKVYPVVYKDGREPLRTYQQHAIERIVNNLGGILIYAYASLPWIKHVYETRGEDTMTLDMVPLEQKLFCDAINKSILDRILLYSPEFNADQMADFYEKLDVAFKKGQEYADRVKKFKSNGRGYIMLVGDSYNENVDLPYRHAFSDYKGSSDYLAKTAYLLGGYKHQLYLTNSGDPTLLKEEIETVNPVITIALGKEADAKLAELKIDHETVDHPQFRKRFMNGQLKLYAKELKEKINKAIERVSV